MITSMIHYSGTNDILRLQATSTRDGVDFNLAYIGPDFTEEHKVSFDQPYMRALCEHGHEKARRGYPRSKGHPLLSAVQAGARQYPTQPGAVSRACPEGASP